MLANFTALNLLNIMGSMDGRIDHVFMIAANGHFVNEDIETLTEAYKIGTVILLHGNVSTTVRLIQPKALLQDLIESCGHSEKFFIAIDKEGWLVARINPYLTTQLPGSTAFGATGDHSNASKVDYEPVADTHSKLNSLIIEAMKAGVDAVTHKPLPRLDNTSDVVIGDLPANLNPDVIRNLRGEMKYKIDIRGLKVSATDLITNVISQGSYIYAGADYVMVCHTLKAQVGAIETSSAAGRNTGPQSLNKTSSIHARSLTVVEAES
ncbi:uncharacterized protein EAF01_008870 [Botrytis porri]|uniref:Uncharacterized protein n=1 Tax=Botrytis porri TaxID=87229 RepID=A0A4Z1KQQ0_9HELO|nr:uncharacterized protein EAF01_008870 [Botrytis porri]KAF7897904.1 hypothetical protein EAF01_008870 [Botrytis porri]TGO86324.1 hypothetical protein BPOR_0313g00040 [Botrytis porri]